MELKVTRYEVAGEIATITLLPYTYDYVRALITTVSPGSLRESKRQIYSDLHRDVRAAISESVALVERLVTEPDFAEGVSALVEKRPPQWGKQEKGRA